MIGAGSSKTLDNVQSVAMKISCPVEPGLIVETRSVDDQCLTLPVTVRPSHPTIGRRLCLIVHIHREDGVRVLMNEHDVLSALNKLEKLRHIRRARDTG